MTSTWDEMSIELRATIARNVAAALTSADQSLRFRAVVAADKVRVLVSNTNGPVGAVLVDHEGDVLVGGWSVMAGRSHDHLKAIEAAADAHGVEWYEAA